jgi:hypothetical protein
MIMNRIQSALRLLAALLLGASLSARAELTFDYRVSVYWVSFADLSFSSANARYDVHVDVSGQDGDQFPGYRPSVRTGQVGFSWTPGTYSGTSDAFLTLSHLVDPGSSGAALGDLALSGGTRGAYDFGYDTPAADLGSSFLQTGTASGHRVLDFRGGGNGLLDAGNLFVLVVFAQGDWTGANAAQLQLLGINPAFNVTDNFSTYNAALNATIFTASALSDGSATFGPDLQFRLLGEALPVPEPQPVALLGAGLLAMLVISRRRVRARR